ncbi:hypothetical protein I3760_10G019100 [Carya illinoinensis]|uniref:START domain-containing protein n=1 Tax=Carya illinoinensis TaxID=32201 RepID=A0A8T1P319_CARIL|nr:uncharacterized protein LOC122279129 [Carya illinoinensis]XP_042945431.1 uncharacterized protein LOC122279129 [Carya illinoinensis]XP_042945432.1 uncharacterized protein LOC122279129 [Carya illinoinensis]XP_042945433.1 uncharacterized protein LOC122279129 [Carya illinoinensis]XP_042945435.1 uncharacterized protein LOC122279129 [Carya illinoinensis]KAG2683136.1 hypothetical protein I3760_10G019100 [Carya illinoinensis]KAG2683137.1 hypothetical protein I3760_10G019100 [Carya illinoinensis]K
MEEKQMITQYRERLDKTLSSPDLTNEETLKTLVKNQLLHSLEDGTEGCNLKVIERRTAEVSYFLDMLRSASTDDNEGLNASERSHAEWKLKQDSKDFRVMYREGPEGTPFHTLLAEGFVDGPVDVCLCISWESILYKKWWPQSSVPTFKILSCKCLQKVQIGEQICSVRMKVPWPLSTREAIVHYFMFEYFQDDLIIVLLNTISHSESIDSITHGFTSEGIPEENDAVRIDVIGGFALQKVAPERSYFRTITNMDIKLDFIPPSLINFVSRQLVGNGFRLYQKVVSSMSSDKDFVMALGDPLYGKIRDVLYPIDVPKRAVKGAEIKADTCLLPKEHLIVSKQDDLMDTSQEVHNNYHANESEPESERVTGGKAFGEIEEEENEENSHFEEDSKDIDHISTKEFGERYNVNDTKNILIRPEVEQALGTLEKIILVVREYGFNAQRGISSGFNGKEPPNREEGLTTHSNSSNPKSVIDDEVSLEVPKTEIVNQTSQDQPRNSVSNHSFRHAGSNSLLREANHNKIAPASPEQHLLVPGEGPQVALGSSSNRTTEVQTLDESSYDIKQMSTKANGIHEMSLNREEKSSRQKKNWLCCFSTGG